MDRLQVLLVRAQAGNKEAEFELAALLERDIMATSCEGDRFRDTYDSIRSELILAIRSGKMEEFTTDIK